MDLLVPIMESTRDLTPLHWLNAKLLQDVDTKRRAAVEQLSLMMPQIASLLADAGVAPKAKR